MLTKDFVEKFKPGDKFIRTAKQNTEDIFRFVNITKVMYDSSCNMVLLTTNDECIGEGQYSITDMNDDGSFVTVVGTVINLI